MSLYIIEDDDGNVLTNDGDFDNNIVYAALYDEPLEPAKDIERYGGHVVTLTDEPEKVVLSKEQAEIVERAHDHEYPASYISKNSYEEKLLMEAFVNGCTVETEKKYNVKVPKNWSGDDKHYWSKEQDGSLTWACLINKDYMIPTYQFTLTEIEHYDLQDCEKEEVTDED